MDGGGQYRGKRDYRGTPVFWSREQNRYRPRVPQTEDQIEEVLQAPQAAWYSYVDEVPQDLADKTGPGYGGSDEWPFDFKKCACDDGYRSGVYNAMQSMWPAANWRAAAQKGLDRVWRVRRRAAAAAYKFKISFHDSLIEQVNYNAF